jgi:hypothetical protein
MRFFTISFNRVHSLYGLVILILFTSCKQNPETFAIHSPIYPTGSQTVTYTLHRLNGDVQTVNLYISTSNVNSAGTVSGTTSESLVNTWSSPSAFPISFTSSSGYGTNKLVNYHFEVIGNSKTYHHRISFATSPYPVANAAVPVYTVGDVDTKMNAVFIPDADMTGNLTLFYTHVARDIDSAFHREDWVRRFPYSYNFFINPFSGTAGDYNLGTPHVYPSNSASLSFAQVKIILHSSTRRDFRDGSNYVGTEYYNRGTILHETGHALYNMADEYEGGSHWQNADLPNNWSSLAGAQSAAPGVGKTAADAVKIGTDPWWKLCNGDCMMLRTGLNVWPYDAPCRNRIFYSLVQRASGN